MKNIKTQYKRELKNNYLIISCANELESIITEHDYEYRMLEGNFIEGLMRLYINKTDNVAKLYYDITSLQPLSRILEARYISSEDIRNIALNIVKIILNIKRYLLSEESLYIQPDYIYADPETLSLTFCCMPGFESDFCTNLSQLFSNILSRMDHNDHDGVVLAYSLYQESLKEGYAAKDLLMLLSRYGKTVPAEYKEIYEENSTDYNETKVCNSPVLLSSDNKDYTAKKQVKKELFNFKKLFSKKLKIAEDTKSSEYKTDTEIPVLREIKQPEYSHDDNTKSMYKDNTEPEFNNIEDSVEAAEKETWINCFRQKDNMKNPAGDIEEISTRTILLSKHVSDRTAGEKFKLRCTDKTGDDININYFPFIIGSQERVCDYTLNSEKISSLHLKLDKTKEKKYTITDLNSLYGTKLNGRVLESDECSDLNIGDEIEFAEIKYTFDI